MACYKPLTGYRAAKADPVTGRRGITFSVREGYADLPVELPCGQCIGCRLERSRQWAMRCVHEASLHDRNCFLTLTYKPECVPARGMLNKADFQKFMKRLRKHIEPRRVSFFHCGEYGEELGRPHYHALIFGYDFDDKKPWKQTKDGTLYTSELLSSLWGLGHAVAGPVTFQTAAYTARYALKKVTGKAAAEHYRRVDQETGEVYQLPPEYITMSLKPAIGRGWFERFKSDVYPSDSVIHKGRELKVPAYYDRLFKREAPEALLAIKDARVKRAQTPQVKKEQTRSRRAVRLEVKLASIATLKRGFHE